MNTTYKTQIKVQADINSTWNAVTQSSFAKAFFPEIKKDLTCMGEYVRKTHKNAEQVLPSYMIPHRAIGWTTGAGTTIELPRKDVHANIESIDLQLDEQGNNTIVSIEVVYAPNIDKHFFFTNRCVKGLMDIKLAVLKQDLETDSHQAGWEAALA